MRMTTRNEPRFLSPAFSMGGAARRMTLHLAAAMLIFTLLQLWTTLAAMELGAPRWLPLVGLVMLVLGAIPFARMRENRWSQMRFGTLPSPAVAKGYRRDLMSLWLLTLAVPPVWTLLAFLLFARH